MRRRDANLFITALTNINIATGMMNITTLDTDLSLRHFARRRRMQGDYRGGDC